MYHSPGHGEEAVSVKRISVKGEDEDEGCLPGAYRVDIRVVVGMI